MPTPSRRRTRHLDHPPPWSRRAGAVLAEIDRGTEDLTRLAGKITAYDTFARDSGHVWPVLFWLGTDLRERHLHARLADQPPERVPVATATRQRATGQGSSPAQAVWWLHGHHDPDLQSLGDLAGSVRAFDRQGHPPTIRR